MYEAHSPVVELAEEKKYDDYQGQGVKGGFQTTHHLGAPVLMRSLIDVCIGGEGPKRKVILFTRVVFSNA